MNGPNQLGQVNGAPSLSSVVPTSPMVDKLSQSAHPAGPGSAYANSHAAAAWASATAGASSATGMPEWYQQMGYHQYYSQADPYGLNNSQVLI